MINEKIISFQKWLQLQENFLPKIYVEKFVNLPWNWKAMQREKIVNALYYYPKDSYVNNQPEHNEDFNISLITLPNLKSIPPDELSVTNLHSGNKPNQEQFFQMLKNPQTWYDDKINQVYEGIKMINKYPEDFGGKDIR